MTPSGYEESFKALKKADEALESATYNLEGEFFAAVANRSYYACYYCIIALLYTQNVYSKTHQGSRAKFSELFIKTSIFPIETSDTITMLFDYRQEADYDLDEEISYEEAQRLIHKATDFYHLSKTYFENLVNDLNQS